MSRPPPPLLIIPDPPYEADSSHIGLHSSPSHLHSPLTPHLPNLPDITIVTTHLTTLASSLTSPPSPTFPVRASSLEENWFKLHSPPSELSWLSGDEPEEVTTEVAGFSESLRERYYATTTRGEREMECSLEVVVEEVEDARRSSGIESNAGSDIFVSPIGKHMSPVRWPGDEAQISRRTSVATTTSSGSTSSGGGEILRLAPKQRSIKHAMVMPGVLLYTPYYTSSAPGSEMLVGPPLVSPRAEAIKKYLRNRKAQSECVSCLEDHRNKKLTTLSCQHRYCSGCLRTLINTAVTDEALFPPKCCLAEIPTDIINSTLTRSERSVYKAKLAEYQVPYGDRLHCPRPTCSAWIPPIDIDNAQYDIKCRKCKHKICRYCKSPTHPAGTECPKDTGMAAVIDIAHQNGWRRCYQCHAVVERSTGCRHMTCRCKAEFCYICGAKWRTCSCNGNEAMRNRPRVVIDGVAAQEQSEVRAAIAAVEEAERVEEQELRRAEIAEEVERQRREAEERSRREREARNLRDEVERNLKAIEERYEMLFLALETLQKTQHGHMQARHQKEREESTQRWKDQTASLALQMSTRIKELKRCRENETASLRTTHEELVAALQTKHESEEDEYWFSLQRHLRGKPNKEARAQTLIDRLKDTQALEAEEMQKRHGSETARLQRRIVAEGLEALKSFTAKKKRIETEEKGTQMDAVLIWKAQERWMEVVEGDRRSGLLARKTAEEEAERRRLPVVV